MRIKLDENLPEILVSVLKSLGHDADTVRSEGFAGHEDQVVWMEAQREKRFFITQDLDFSNIQNFAPGTHHGLLLIRLHLPGREALTGKIRQIFQREPAESWCRCFVVVSDLKIRVIRPPKGTGVGQP